MTGSAKQSIDPREERMDCFVASAPRNDELEQPTDLEPTTPTENPMSVVIRLARAGTKKRPVYHVVVADSRFPRDGRFIERLGHFNPLLAKDNEARLKLDMDKVKAWLAKGAQPPPQPPPRSSRDGARRWRQISASPGSAPRMACAARSSCGLLPKIRLR